MRMHDPAAGRAVLVAVEVVGPARVDPVSVGSVAADPHWAAGRKVAAGDSGTHGWGRAVVVMEVVLVPMYCLCNGQLGELIV